MDVLTVVKQLKALATDKSNRETIVKDQGCLPGLVLFLDNPDINVVITALETLILLAQCVSNRSVIRDELGMLMSLDAIINRHAYNSKAKELARTLKHTIVPQPLSPLREKQNVSENKPSSKHRYAGKAFITGNKKFKLVILHINGLDNQACRKICEEELLVIKGVISFTFDMAKKRCVLRTKADLKPEIIVAAISRTKIMSAEQVIKNEHGEEVMLTFGANPATVNKENDNLPKYLPEENSPLRGLDKAMTRINGPGSEESRGWLSSAASFISTNFYW
ncbi:armadillo repeat-containing protein 1-like [Anneissia japonica]|uniref:armadillo repeat-containing protein 1-like n=1 Tax=Anneissia japonica TaxID=1529436 RepID=UPI00142591D3|nr:armadillo repeat-containing protein 1-like [Anneissia japonica]